MLLRRAGVGTPFPSSPHFQALRSGDLLPVGIPATGASRHIRRVLCENGASAKQNKSQDAEQVRSHFVLQNLRSGFEVELPQSSVFLLNQTQPTVDSLANMRVGRTTLTGKDGLKRTNPIHQPSLTDGDGLLPEVRSSDVNRTERNGEGSDLSTNRIDRSPSR